MKCMKCFLCSKCVSYHIAVRIPHISLLRRIDNEDEDCDEAPPTSQSRTCPGKPAPLGQGFASLDLMEVSRSSRRPAGPTLSWEQDRRQQRGRDGEGVLSTGLRSGRGEDRDGGCASEPGSSPGREAVPGSHWPNRRPSLPGRAQRK